MTTHRATKTSQTAPTSRDATPTGRDAVVAAVLDHAADLFAERGPTATSIRDIAERAGVNHGLVFRHFGAKEQLVGQVLEYLGTDTEAHVEHAGLGTDDPRLRRHWTVIARCLLDGYPVGELQQRFPTMERLVTVARSAYPDEQQAALAAAHIGALILGWELFGPFLRSATGLQDTPETELCQAITERATGMLQPHGPAGQK
ncbi:TetR/AcrR family transcriptional regulator [Nocardia sp. NPDC088792]|uniref:TetR/AcrR family transcriptional regulator n=1 Tax=Nocardia sp. NPDC088792 TaxID=3364332 RepID=UPI0038196261